jgi:hypothetical protein
MGLLDRLLGRKQEQLAEGVNMAEHPNVALLRRGYEAFSKGDMATIAALFSEDAVYHVPGSHLLSGDHRGRDAVLGVLAKLGELSGGTLSIDVHEVLATDDHGVVLHWERASRQGKQLDSLETVVYHLRGGKITEMWSFFYDQRTEDEFWS